MSPRPALALLALLAALATPALVSAHAELVSSTPPAGATLDAPPAEVVLVFSGELDPDGSSFTVSVGGNEVASGEVDLQVAERNVMRAPLGGAVYGAYSVAWTSMASDGDVVEGTFGFTVTTIGDAAMTDRRVADIATVSGVLLLLAGLSLAARRLPRAGP